MEQPLAAKPYSTHYFIFPRLVSNSVSWGPAFVSAPFLHPSHSEAVFSPYVHKYCSERQHHTAASTQNGCRRGCHGVYSEREEHRPLEEGDGRDALLLRRAGQARDGAVQRTAFIVTIVRFQISSAATNGYRYPQTEEKCGGKAGMSYAASPLRSDL